MVSALCSRLFHRRHGSSQSFISAPGDNVGVLSFTASARRPTLTFTGRSGGYVDPQSSFPIQLSPVENLVGIHVMSTRHSRHRRPGHQRLLHDVPPFFNGSAPLLLPRRARRSILTECVHVPSVWAHTTVSTLPSSSTTLYRGSQRLRRSRGECAD
jgi:hypothetical protein